MNFPVKKRQFFTRQLMKWFAGNHRPLPWKAEKDPYVIWLSEIILQQTRVEQGLPYFERFRQRFPRIKDLADASEDEVMKLWEGLGYYSRARNLHATAKYVAYELKGQFPSNYSSILALRGVGPYTAAAISSFAFNLPEAVVDGNVYRVLARVFGIDLPIDSTEGKKCFKELAQALLDESQPGNYNQAIMDFGAVHCRSRQPKCQQCPMQQQCVAFQQQSIGQLPVKSKKIKRKTRYFNYFLLNVQQAVYLQKRVAKDIWQQLYQFPLIEADAILDPQTFSRDQEVQALLPSSIPFQLKQQSRLFKQQLTHQTIIASFWEIQLEKPLPQKKESHILVERKNLNKFAFPKIIDLYLQDKALYLDLR